MGVAKGFAKRFHLPGAAGGDGDLRIHDVSDAALRFAGIEFAGCYFARPKPQDWDSWSQQRQISFTMVSHEAFDALIGVVVVLQIGLTCRETDLIAKRREVPAWIDIFSYVLLGIFILEIAFRMFALRSRFLASYWDAFDVIVVSMDMFLTLTQGAIGQVPSITVVRVFRLFRLVRMFRVLRAFHELNTMIHLIGGALRSLISAFVLLFLIFTICSLAAVDLIQPIVTEIAARGGFEDDCTRCSRQFESVMQANLTWFQAIIMGDNWGSYFTPIIEHTPAAGILFVIVTLVVALGLLNILMSVIVSKAEDARRTDHREQLQLKTLEFEHAKAKLLKICESLDTNKSGTLTFAELEDGMKTNAVFAEALRVLDIGHSDVNVLFDVLDEDGSGSITYEEFVVNLHKMKAEDSHTLLVFIKHFVTDLRRKMSEEIGLIRQEVAKTDEIRGVVVDTLKIELASRVGSEFGSDDCRTGLEQKGFLCRQSSQLLADTPQISTAGNPLGMRPSDIYMDVLGKKLDPSLKPKKFVAGNRDSHTQTDSKHPPATPLTSLATMLQERPINLSNGTPSTWEPLQCANCQQEIILNYGDGLVAILAKAARSEEKETKSNGVSPLFSNYPPEAMTSARSFSPPAAAMLEADLEDPFLLQSTLLPAPSSSNSGQVESV